jgi:hypothetical protein
MWVFSLVERENAVTEDMRLDWCVHLDEVELASKSVEIQFQGKRRHRMFIQLKGVEILEPGSLTFTLDYGGELTVKTWIEVTESKDED